MKKVSLLVLLIMFLQGISSATLWFDGSDTLVSDTVEPIDVYIGIVNDRHGDKPDTYLYPGRDLFAMLPEGAEVTIVDHPMYTDMVHLVSPYPEEMGVILLDGLSGSVMGLYDADLNLIGSHSHMLTPPVMVYANESYQIGPGESVEFFGYQFNNPSDARSWYPGEDLAERCFDGWSINGTEIPYQVSYEYLTEDLGLSNGEYQLKIEKTIYWDENDTYGYNDYDYTTIIIVPEPISISMLVMGGIILRKRMK